MSGEASARGRRNRGHGHETERMIVRWLQTNGYPDARTTRSQLGHDGATAPGDISFHPLVCLEAKSVASSAWPSWCRQAAAEARPGMIPAVIRRTRGVPDVGVWELRVRCWEWFCVFDDTAPEVTPWVDVAHDDDAYRWALTSLPVLLDALHDIDHQENPT